MPQSWSEIIAAAEDESGLFTWDMLIEGRLDDPTWDPHDYMLRDLEYKIKEKAAANGLRVDGTLFFYADQER